MNIKAVWLALIFGGLAAAGAFAQSNSDTTSEFDRGLKAYDAGQYTTAYDIWWKIKDANLAALRNVALMLRNGQGVKKDPKKAEALFETATSAGLTNAEVDLAEMLLNGEAGAPNPKRALGLLQDAVSNQNPVAEYLLGQMYETGNTVPTDINRATDLYMAAARAGLKDAKDRLVAIGIAAPPAAPKLTQASSAPATPPSATQTALRAAIATSVGPSSTSQTPTKPAPSVTALVPPTPTSRPPSKPVSVAAAPPPPAPSHQVPSANSGTENADSAAYSLQLGSYKSVASAEAAWTEARREQLLATARHQVKQVELGEKGTWYRLLVVGFKDLAAARSFCDQLKATGDVCLVIHSEA